MRGEPLALFCLLKEDLATNLSYYPDNLDHPSRVDRDFWPDSEIKHVAAVSLLASILKKYEDTGETADQLALQKFLACNDRCNRQTPFDVGSLYPVDELIINEFEKELYFFFDDVDYSTIFREDKVLPLCGFGPGASRGSTGDTPYHKLGSSPLTGTSRYLFRVWKTAVSQSPTWLVAEKIRSSRYGGVELVEGSKLFFVPKTREISRTICVEPTLNMFLQKGLASIIRNRLTERYGIDLSIQPAKNVRLARIGSRSGKLGTIDLQSASDSISMRFLEHFVRPTTMWWFRQARSPQTILPDGRIVDLHMVASMGNDFTFPLQTLLFTALVVATYRVMGIPIRYPRGNKRGNFAVFGDDIIVRSESYATVCRLLESFGFMVNHDKSFNEGPFRESCGADFFLGQNVRGVYCTSLKTLHDTYSLVNRLSVWSCNHGIPLPRTLSYLWRGIPKKFRFPVPPWDDVVAGIRVPLFIAQKAVWSRTPWICSQTGSILYKAFRPVIEGPNVSRLGDTRYDEKGHLTVSNTFICDRKLILHNPAAILMCASGGFLRTGKLSLRQRRTRYKKRTLTSPGWDWQGPSEVNLLTPRGWQRFSSGFAVPAEVQEQPGFASNYLTSCAPVFKRPPGMREFSLMEIYSMSMDVLHRLNTPSVR